MHDFGYNVRMCRGGNFHRHAVQGGVRRGWGGERVGRCGVRVGGGVGWGGGWSAYGPARLAQQPLRAF